MVRGATREEGPGGDTEKENLYRRLPISAGTSPHIRCPAEGPVMAVA